MAPPGSLQDIAQRMTPDERNLLDQFLSDLARARPATKDAEAAQRIEGALRGNPDAAYVLVQHAILADQALAGANDRIAELESQMQGGRPDDRSFLGSALGGARPNPYGPNGSAVPPTAPGAYGYGGQGPAWGGGGGQPGPFSGGGGIGNFLRNAGTTAAGVAGGAFLFEGLSGMFGGHHGGQGFGGFGGGDNVTVNEFSGDGDYPDTGGDIDVDGYGDT